MSASRTRSGSSTARSRDEPMARARAWGSSGPVAHPTRTGGRGGARGDRAAGRGRRERLARADAGTQAAARDDSRAARAPHVLLGRLVREAGAGERGDGAWFRPQTIMNDLRALGLLDDEELHWWFSLLSPTPADAGDISGPREPLARLERFLRSIPAPQSVGGESAGSGSTSSRTVSACTCTWREVGAQAIRSGAPADEVEPGASFVALRAGDRARGRLRYVLSRHVRRWRRWRLQVRRRSAGAGTRADLAGEVPAEATKLFVRLLDLTFTVGL